MKKEPLIRHIRSIISGTWGDDPDGVEDVFCLRVADFSYGNLTNIKPATRRKISAQDRNIKILKEKDILIEKSGGGDKTPVGRGIMVRNIISNNTTYANFIDRITLKDTLIPEYTIYVLSSMYSAGINGKYIKQNTGIQNLDVKAYLSEAIDIPPLQTQKKIAAYLDQKTATIDKMITAKNHTHTHLLELRAAIIAKSIGGVAMIEGSKAYSLKRLSTLLARGASPDYSENGGVTFINQACIYWDGLKMSATKKANAQTHPANSKGYVKKNDILINSTGTGTLGRAVLFDADNDGSIFADSHVMILRPDTKIIDPKYLLYVIRSNKVQDEIYTWCVSGSTNQIELSREKLRDLTISVPPLHIQREIVNKIDSSIQNIELSISKLTKSKELLTEYRSSLISNVVGGKVEI